MLPAPGLRWARPQAGLGVGPRQAGQGCAARSPPAPTRVSRPPERMRLPAAHDSCGEARRKPACCLGASRRHARVDRMVPCQACCSSIVLTRMTGQSSTVNTKQHVGASITKTVESVREHQGIQESSHTGTPRSLSLCRRVGGAWRALHCLSLSWPTGVHTVRAATSPEEHSARAPPA